MSWWLLSHEAGKQATSRRPARLGISLSLNQVVAHAQLDAPSLTACTAQVNRAANGRRDPSRMELCVCRHLTQVQRDTQPSALVACQPACLL